MARSFWSEPFFFPVRWGSESIALFAIRAYVRRAVTLAPPERTDGTS
ncbi:MAG TPA: hypothetical protein VK544_07400 [Gemmatimonadaceae bacterium]|nr:hypothetical protein [Gemmatimonadaceae bacterium]